VTDLPFPLSGSTLVLGPSRAGKTRLTARAIEAWIEAEGTDGVVVFEFGPDVERNGRVLGGRLDRFTTIPDGVWHGVLDAHAPRTEGESEDEILDLARENAQGADRLFEAAPPDPRAVFVNDATIPFQHEVGDPEWLLQYLDSATCAVVNALESTELGVDDPVSRREREVLAVLSDGMDRIVELPSG
jgi:hypothetical protein